MQTRPATRLYIHVPFCRTKCDYCAFYSVTSASAAQHEAYLRRLEREFADVAGLAGDLDSVFVGGGTPSVLGPGGLGRLTGLVRQYFHLQPAAEVTVEANPDRLDGPLCEALAAGGANRISMGLQTFSPTLRRVLGRQVDAACAPAAVAALRRAGIRRLNADLIFQIPGQSLRQWTDDLRRTLELGFSHLSAYALTVEEGTRLAARLPPGNSSDDRRFEAMWQRAAAVAEGYGLRRYEISNFACPGDECRHNLGIWHGDTYVGCGPAAASFDGVRRWTNPADLQAWLSGQPPEVDELPPLARAAEILAFGLRTVAGWDLARFRAVTGLSPDDICPETIRELVGAGLLEVAAGALRTTPAGMLVHDAIAERIIRMPSA